MAKEERDDEAGIYKVDTVPPPDGSDGDAYSAPTRVGPVTSEAWAELLRKANEEGKARADAEAEAPPRSGIPSSGPQSKPRAAPVAADAPLPRLHGDNDGDDSDGEGDAATKLGPDAHALMARAQAAPPTPANNIPTPPMATAAPQGLAAPAAPRPPLPPAAAAPAAPPLPAAPPPPLPASAMAAPASAPASNPIPFPANLGPPPSSAPVPQRSASRGIRLVFAVCLAIFAVGLALFLLR